MNNNEFVQIALKLKISLIRCLKTKCLHQFSITLSSKQLFKVICFPLLVEIEGFSIIASFKDLYVFFK